MLVNTTTDCGCSARRSGKVASVSRVSSMLTSLPTTKNGTVGNRQCISRSTALRTIPLPVPASNNLNAGGRGAMWAISRPIRAATSAFSLVVMTNSRYFSRLSKNRNGSALAPPAAFDSSTSVTLTPRSTRRTYPDQRRLNIRLAPSPLAGQVPDDLLGRQLAGTTGDASARMRPRTTLVVAVDRRAVLVPSRRRAEEVHLRRQELAGEDVALAESDDALDVERCDDLPVQHQVAEPGEERLQRRLHRVAERLTFGVPVAAFQLIGRVLDEAGHHVLARWRHVGVDQRLQAGVDVRALAVPAVL